MDPWAVALATIAGLIGIYYFFFHNLDYFKKAGVPHIKPVPVFGNFAPTIFRQAPMTDILQKIYHLNPEAKYAGIYDFTSPVVMIRDLDLIKQIAVKHFDNFPDHRNFVDETIEPFFGKNLFGLRGEKWKDMRTLLSPAFTSSKMKAMFKLMSDCALNFAEYWQNVPSETGECVDTKDAFTRYTNDVIATCAFGISVDSIRDRDNDFYVLGKEGTTFTPSRSLKFFLMRNAAWLNKLIRLKLISKRVCDFFTNVIETTIRTRDEQNIIRPDMIQLMMESRGKRGDKELSIEDMTCQAFVFFFGGFDTTSTLMCFAAHEIAMHPEVQDKLRAEIEQTMEETNGELTYEALHQMKYLDAVINEALRLYPVVIATDRACVKDFVLPPALPDAKPVLVKKGMYIWFPVYALHRDPAYFKEPDKFIPERFLEENKKDINMASYLPFGIGPRMCIGNRFALMETKVMLFHLLSKTTLKPCKKTPNPILISKKTIAMTPEGGFWLSIEPRSLPDKNIQILANGVSKTS